MSEKRVVPVRVIFFDLGNTLVKNNPNPSSGRPFEWIDGAKESLEQFKERGVRLGLISNTGDHKREELLQMMPADFNIEVFEKKLVILSSEVGVAKPSLQIFAHAIQKAETAPVECLFCTEELFHTLVAQEIGMRAVWLPITATGNIKRLVTDLIKDQLI